jgi:hypothetical protein
MKTILYLSMVCASISFTVTETKLFKPLREGLKKKLPFLGDLFSCGYCFGHWVAFALVAVYRPRLFAAAASWWWLDYFLTALVMAWLSGLQWALMCWLMDKAGK